MPASMVLTNFMSQIIWDWHMKSEMTKLNIMMLNNTNLLFHLVRYEGIC